jgi:DNA-binding PadR family transcriptional regulator
MKHGRRRFGRRRNFWHAWREEQRRHWEEQHGEPWPPGRPPSDAHAWREFFHGFTGAWPENHWAFSGRRFRPWHQGIDSFNPFVASILSKGGGLLPLVVLHLLSEQPRYGNEIMALLTERTSGQWVANPGAIYPLMSMLEERNLVQGEWEDPQKRTVRIYRLTEAGQEEVDRLKAIVRPKLVEAIKVLQELARDLNGDEFDEFV